MNDYITRIVEAMIQGGILKHGAIRVESDGQSFRIYVIGHADGEKAETPLFEFATA